MQSGLVFNTICATLILAEPFTRYSLLGTVLVAGGAVLIGTFGAMTEPSHNLQQLLDLLARRNFIIWLSGTFFFAFAIAILAWFSYRIWPRVHPRIRLLQGMMYGAVSGILCAHTLLVAKSAVELLVRTIVDQHNQFNRWQSWLILVSLLVLALSQLYYLHLGLRLCSTSVLYPFVFCIYNIIAILDGLIYFRQTSRLKPLHAGLIAVGTIVLLAGVVALSWRLDEGPAYTPVAADETGRARRIRSMSRIATPTLPQTVLAPGMGIVEGSPSAVLGEDSDVDDEDAMRVNPDDEEAVLRSAHKPSIDADEATPLLRTTTAPIMKLPRSPLDRTRGSGSSLRPQKTRRTTVTAPGAAEELWDELVESDGYRRRSMDFGSMTGQKRSPAGRSPHSVRWKDRPNSSSSGRKGNGSVNRHGRSNSSGSRMLLDSHRWRFWEHDSAGDEAKSPKRREDSADTDGSDEGLPVASSSRSAARPRSNSANANGVEEDSPVEWFKLKWWKKRWRSKDGLQETG